MQYFGKARLVASGRSWPVKLVLDLSDFHFKLGALLARYWRRLLRIAEQQGAMERVVERWHKP